VSGSFTLTGHPDWIPTQSLPVTVLAAVETGLTPGAWGPITVPCSSGGAYMISLIGAGAISNRASVTDITVEQFDLAGNSVANDFFGAVPSGGSYIGDYIVSGPVIARGNVYGASLQISGLMCTSAYLTDIFPNSGTNIGTIDIAVYILPNGFTDPDPKLYVGQFVNYDTTYTLPPLTLATQVGLSLTDGKSSDAILVAPYSGAAVLTLQQTGVTTTPTNLRCFIYGYTVASGTTEIEQLFFTTPTAVSPLVVPVNLSACMHLINWHNSDSSQTATVNSTLVGARGA